jgi:hypothetical protein
VTDTSFFVLIGDSKSITYIYVHHKACRQSRSFSTEENRLINKINYWKS